jgi:hypothetical protein
VAPPTLDDDLGFAPTLLARAVRRKPHHAALRRGRLAPLAGAQAWLASAVSVGELNRLSINSKLRYSLRRTGRSRIIIPSVVVTDSCRKSVYAKTALVPSAGTTLLTTLRTAWLSRHAKAFFT